jgi:hypothetical protein
VGQIILDDWDKNKAIIWLLFFSYLSGWHFECNTFLNDGLKIGCITILGNGVTNGADYLPKFNRR